MADSLIQAANQPSANQLSESAHMDIAPIVPRSSKIVNAYGNGGFTIGGERVEGAVIAAADMLLAWDIAPGKEIAEADLAPLLALAPPPEILLIGTGKILRPLSPALRMALKSRHIAADAMDTGAACRTYNVLLGEGRIVAAALVAV